MAKSIPQLIIMLTGLLLILAGIGLLIYSVSLPAQNPAGGSFDAALKDLKVRTNHVGLASLGVGAILESVGFIGGTIWSRPSSD